MSTRTVALALLLCFPAFAQPKPSLLPAEEPSPPPLTTVEGDAAEHTASWQFAGLLEGIFTGALVFSVASLAARNQSASGLTKADDAMIGGWTAFGATLFGAAGAWLGDVARDDDGGGSAARQIIVSHGVLLGVGATGAMVLAVILSIIGTGERNDPTQRR